MTDDKANKLEEGFFDYQVSKDNKVFIYWYNKQVVTLSGKQAQKFLAQIDSLDGCRGAARDGALHGQLQARQRAGGQAVIEMSEGQCKDVSGTLSNVDTLRLSYNLNLLTITKVEFIDAS